MNEQSVTDITKLQSIEASTRKKGTVPPRTNFFLFYWYIVLDSGHYFYVILIGYKLIFTYMRSIGKAILYNQKPQRNRATRRRRAGKGLPVCIGSNRGEKRNASCGRCCRSWGTGRHETNELSIHAARAFTLRDGLFPACQIGTNTYISIDTWRWMLLMEWKDEKCKQ